MTITYPMIEIHFAALACLLALLVGAAIGFAVQEFRNED